MGEHDDILGPVGKRGPELADQFWCRHCSCVFLALDDESPLLDEDGADDVALNRLVEGVAAAGDVDDDRLVIDCRACAAG